MVTQYLQNEKKICDTVWNLVVKGLFPIINICNLTHTSHNIEINLYKRCFFLKSLLYGEV